MTNSGFATSFAAMAGFGLLLGGAGAADAANFSVGFPTGSSSQLVGFNQFDPGLGTLTQVDVTLSNVIVGGEGSAFSITGAEGGSFGSTGFSASLRITPPVGGNVFLAAISATSGCTVTSGDSCFDSHLPISPAFVPNPASITGAPNLAPFIGLGTVDLTAGVFDFQEDSLICDLNQQGTGSCIPANGITWSGTLIVNYQFTPAETGVPEPASLAVFGLGLAGLGWVRQRRRA